MIRIAFFHTEYAPYRILMFKKISELPNVHLKVYFGRPSSSSRKCWSGDYKDLDHEILQQINYLDRLFVQPFKGPSDLYPINPSLFLKLMTSKYDVFIGDGPWYFGSQISFLVAKLLRKPFILWTESHDNAFPYDHAAGRFISSKRSYLAYFLDLPFREKLRIPLYLIRLAFSYLVLKLSSAYVAAGTPTKEFLLRRGVPASKIFIAVNAIDNEAFKQRCRESIRKKQPEKLKKKLGLDGKKVILYVGLLIEPKGVQYLIPAFAKLRREDKDVALVVVGDGPYKRELIKVCKENGVDVIFPGYVSNPHPLVNYYLIADVFVLPSVPGETWGFVINEAMVCGCPIVTTANVGASKDLVKNGINGYVVKPRDIPELYHALKNILHNAKLRRRIRKKSREIIENYSFDKSVLGYKSAIESVLKKS
jgi:glycosyltransferase involved in cell wall biosynthesis